MAQVIPLVASAPPRQPGAFLAPRNDELTEAQQQHLYDAAYAETTALLNSGALTPTALLDLRLTMDAELRQQIAEYYQQNPGNPKVACSFGCNHCCTIPIEVRPWEVFVYHAYVRATNDDAAYDAWCRTLRERDRAGLGIPPERRLAAHILCGLNGPNGECLAYQTQPYSCAGYTSYDVGKCKYAATQEHTYPIAGLPRQYSAFTKLAEGQFNAMYDAGFPQATVEITAALRSLIDRPDAWRVWYEDRRDPFPDALWTLRGSTYGDGASYAEQDAELVGASEVSA